jgi:tetratricopeptide (TPR) repeat protein
VSDPPPAPKLTQQIRDQLQATLGSAYTLERELGGGGMSRVFVAEETALRRKVVVKVLPPELTAGVNVERFNREILLAAKLQHPNIVQVLTAGETQGLPYYTMPLVEGESLRARLIRANALSITEAVSVLKDVARALAYAHERGIVHRDIKPDNVLITGGAATVTDFGIAKAISASRTQGSTETLTQIGTSIGTPTYMSPEQAAGDPDTDHRTDIYSFGCMAYELLAGQPPFVERTPRKLLAAHMGEKPRSVTELRPDTPSSLAELVMRCLAKEADDRPQAASALVHVLETVTSSGGSAAMPSVLLGGPGMLKRALAIYAAAFVAVAILAKAAIVGIGLPDWVFPGSLVVMALGLPVILWTGYVQRVARRAMTATPTYTPGGSPSTTAHGTIATMALKAAPHVSWYKTARGGMYAMGVFIALIAVFMVMRQFGIGPFGTLLSRGTLKKDDPILLADFKSPATDTSLGPVVTEALRSELAKSKSVLLAPLPRIREVLLRMQKPANTHVDFPTAREIATREGFKAIIDGEVLMLGNTRVVVARLVAAQTGEELATFRETAKTDDEIVAAIDQLSRDLRERVGESLRTIQSTESMARVTTSSLAALKKFVQGDRAVADGDLERGHALLAEAIHLDTGFAMAYRRLGMSLNNGGTQPARVLALLQKGFEHRGRLSDLERFNLEAAYYDIGPQQDGPKAIAAYEASLELAPDNYVALNNLGVDYRVMRQFAKAESLYVRALALDTLRNTAHSGIVTVLAHQGRLREADAAAVRAERIFVRNPTAFAANRAHIAWQAGQLDSADRLAGRLTALAGRSAQQRGTANGVQANIAFARGRIREGTERRREQQQALAEFGAPAARLGNELAEAYRDVWLRNDIASATRRVDAALVATPLAPLDPINRPHVQLARAQASVGRVDAAKATLADFDRSRQGLKLRGGAQQRAQISADIAMAEKRYDAAIAGYRAAVPEELSWARLPDLARAYDLAGNADSATAIYDRYVNFVGFNRLASDQMYLGPSLKRLGELYEAKGDRDNAIKYYSQFVELWKAADPELQPQVQSVRDKLRKLTPVEGKRP